ncbi:MAG: hypothetical protein JNK05_05545 [Myxococcales bacterium]|nr:hypothetical protein [Myxococcales bacterium]
MSTHSGRSLVPRARSFIAKRALPAAATLAVLGVCTFAAGVEGCGGTTGLRRVSFAMRVGGYERSPGPYTFETRTGWSVTLTEARGAIGPVYFNTIAPLETSGARRSTVRPRFDVRRLFVPFAHAHGESHFGAGRIVAEINEQREFDLLDPQMVSFERFATGVDEPVRTAELWFYNRATMNDSALRVRGHATRGEETVLFSGAFAIDPAAATQEQPVDALRQVRGIPLELIPDEESSVELRVDLRPCFANADFRELLSGTPGRDGSYTFTRRDNVGAGFEAGVRATSGTWRFRVAPKPRAQ